MSKAGLIVLTKAVAREYGPHGIRVFTLSPPVARLRDAGSLPRPTANVSATMNALGRLAAPEEVARSTLLTASGLGGLVTGTMVDLTATRVSDRPRDRHSSRPAPPAARSTRRSGRQAGFRLFGNPVQAIESDLTATALVLGDGATRVVVIGIDLSLVGIDLSLRAERPAQEMRVEIAQALGIPVSHVLLNTSHNHAGVALPDFMPDTPEQMALKERYRRDLGRALVEAAVEADGAAAAGPDRLRLGREHDRRLPARDPRRARRARRGARPPDRPDRRRDPRRRPRRQPDRDRLPLLRATRSRWAPRSAVASSDYPGPAREVVETEPRRPRALPPGLRRQHQPARRDRLRDRLPRHEEPRRPGARRRSAQGRRRHPHRHARRRAAAARQRPQHPLHPLGARRRRHLHPPRAPPRPRSRSTTSTCPRSTRREAILAATGGRRSRSGVTRDAQEWEIRVAREVRGLGASCSSRPSERRAPDLRSLLQAIRVNDIVHRGDERRDVLRDGPRDPGALAASRTPSRSATRTAPSATSRAPRTTRPAAGTSTRPTRCPTYLPGPPAPCCASPRLGAARRRASARPDPRADAGDHRLTFRWSIPDSTIDS